MPRPSLPVAIAGMSFSAVWMATAASAAASGAAIRIMARSPVAFATRPPQEAAAAPMRSRARAMASWAAASPLKPANITVVLRFESIPSRQASGEAPRPQQLAFQAVAGPEDPPHRGQAQEEEAQRGRQAYPHRHVGIAVEAPAEAADQVHHRVEQAEGAPGRRQQ